MILLSLNDVAPQEIATIFLRSTIELLLKLMLLLTLTVVLERYKDIVNDCRERCYVYAQSSRVFSSSVFSHQCYRASSISHTLKCEEGDVANHLVF